MPLRSTSTNCRSTLSTSSNAKNGALIGHEPHRRLGALPDARERIGGRVERLALRAAQAQADLVGQLPEQLFLVLEVPVEEALRHAGRAHDVDDPGVVVAPLGEQAGRAVEQLLLALLPLRREPALRRSIEAQQSSRFLTRGSMWLCR